MLQRTNPAPATNSDTPVMRHLRASHWGATLSDAELAGIERDVVIKGIPSGAFVCKKGEAVEYWVGVVSGLAKMSLFSAEGKLTSLTGLPPGAWFGEGSMLKTGPRLYDVVALRDCEIAYLPRSAFFRLLDTNLGFNRFLIVQLNERLGQFISLVEGERLLEPNPRVARCLANLFNPVLYPGLGHKLEISQEEIGLLAGVSRQRVNQALQVLEKRGLLSVDYGGVTVKDLAGLQRFGA